MHKWKLALAVLAIALFAAWYAFRPERLVVNRPGKRRLSCGRSPFIRTSPRVRHFLCSSAPHLGYCNHLPPWERRSHSPLHELQYFEWSKCPRVPRRR